MVKAELKYTFMVKGRYWYFRRSGTIARLPGKPGEPKFHEAYARLIALTQEKQAPARDTLAALIKLYLGSAEFKALAPRTQEDYAQTLELLSDELGAQPYALITRKMVKAVRDDYAATPRKAHKVKQMMSRLYSWAGEADIVADGVNPAQRLRRLKRQGGEREITVWSEAEIGLFLAHCPPHIETAVLLGLYTGQRSSDVCRMTWGQYLGGAIRVRQSKTGALLEIPCHPVLRAHLEALKAKGTNSLTIVTGTTGRPSNPNQLSTAINRACAAIVGMPARSFHGLRYAAGSMLEEAGCTIGEIEAVLGHNTLKMAMKYATQRLRAKAALARVEEQEQNKKLQTRSEKVQTRVDK